MSMNNILPSPYETTFVEGHFTVCNNTTIFSDFKDSDNIVSLIQEYFTSVCDISVSYAFIDKNKGNNFIYLKKDKEIPEEWYEITINDVWITICASRLIGLYYAFQSLIQISTPGIESVTIQKWYIFDKPRFLYRGFMLDVSRHFFSVDSIKKLIKDLSEIKINYLHLHLTDDQWWRLEIKRYPKLVSIWSRREQEGIEYSGFYSQDDMKDILMHAQEHFVTIIPEIDIPWHCSALLAAYPEFACSDNSHKVENKWVVDNANLCPNENTLEFLCNILEEIMDLFPWKYIHIWCDEFNENVSQNSSMCAICISHKWWKNIAKLYNDFLTEIVKYIESKGKGVIAWDELLEYENISEATIMSWRSTQWAIRASQEGRQSILTPHEYLYLNYPQRLTPNDPHYLPLEKICSFDPDIKDVDVDENKLILWIQWCLWTEYIDTKEKLYDAIFPRILAVSELWWSSKEINFEDFQSKIGTK